MRKFTFGANLLVEIPIPSQANSAAFCNGRTIEPSILCLEQVEQFNPSIVLYYESFLSTLCGKATPSNAPLKNITG